MYRHGSLWVGIGHSAYEARTMAAYAFRTLPAWIYRVATAHRKDRRMDATPSLPIGARATSEWEVHHEIRPDGVTEVTQRCFCVQRGDFTMVGTQDMSGRVTDVCLDVGGVCLDLATAEALAGQLPGILAEFHEWCPPSDCNPRAA